jgi:tetrahydromethanopterin S-methyltransferase subunit E
MDKFEKVGYSALAVLAIIYLSALLIGLIAAFPLGLIGFIGLIGVGALFIKVVKERLSSKEDDYYSKNVEK